MSADHKTEHYEAYFHEGSVDIFEKGSGAHVGWFTPEITAELSEITDAWQASKKPAPKAAAPTRRSSS